MRQASPPPVRQRARRRIVSVTMVMIRPIPATKSLMDTPVADAVGDAEAPDGHLGVDVEEEPPARVAYRTARVPRRPIA